MSAASIPQSDLEAKLTPNEQQRLRREFMCAMTNAQANWMDGVMKRVMPKKLYRMVRDESPPWSAFEERQRTVGEWLDKNDIRIVQRGAHIQQLFKGSQLLSTFVVKLTEK